MRAPMIRLPKTGKLQSRRLDFPPGRADEDLVRVLERGKVFPDPDEVETSAEEFRKAHPRLTALGLSRRLTAIVCRRLAKIGAAATAPGVVPGIGTIAQIGALTATGGAETWLLFRNLAWLHYHIAHFYGHDLRSPDRKTELILAWGLATKVVERTAGTGRADILKRQLLRRSFRGGAKNLLERIATMIGASVGAHHGPPVLGRLLPFGIGVSLTAGTNYLLVRQFGRASIELFEAERRQQGVGVA